MLAADRLCAHAHRVGRVAQVEMFQVARTLRFPCQVFLREPCLLQNALNGPKCNRNYASPVLGQSRAEMPLAECAHPRAQQSPITRTCPMPLHLRCFPTLLRPGTGALRQGPRPLSLTHYAPLLLSFEPPGRRGYSWLIMRQATRIQRTPSGDRGSRFRGFTLIELLVVIAIIGILAE